MVLPCFILFGIYLIYNRKTKKAACFDPVEPDKVMAI